MKKILFTFKRIFFLLVILSIPLSLSIFFYIHSLSTKIAKKFSGPRWNIPSKVYSDSFPLFEGLNIHSMYLKEKLDRLGYQEVLDEVTREGEYKIEPLPSENQATWTLYLHAFDYPLKPFKGTLVQFDVADHIITHLRAKKNLKQPFEELLHTELEPELITAFFENAREERQVVKLEEIPSDLLNAIISIEDQRFLAHSGIDPKGILRAFYSNLRAGSIVQGGSTITQQLVKNFFLTQEKSYLRKLNEAIMALIVESHYSKDEILEAYVNEIYFGQKGSAGIFGVAEATRFYFAKPLHKLTLAECAMLAGIIRGPALYSPFKSTQRALERRNFVLKKMFETKTILRNEYEQALQELLRPRKIPTMIYSSPYFVDFVKSELMQRYSEDILNTQGLRIFTTLDVSYQNFANDALQQTLQQLEAQHTHLKPTEEIIGEEEHPFDQRLQGALVVIQPQTGYVRALVGGRDYSMSQFNRITQAHRQPGSLFKPFVLLTAFTLYNGKKYTLTNRFSDEPFQWKYGKQTWEPKNYDEETRGEISLRMAIEYSVNVSIARLAQEIGIKKIKKISKKLGIQSHLPEVPSLSLGSIEVTPFEMAAAYSILANGGVAATPISITQVVDLKGNVLEKRSIEIKKVVSQEAAFLVTYALEGAINNGTGRSVRLFGFDREAAGKTGTSSGYMDAWFAGYTPDLVGVSWIGFDKPRSLELSGAEAALPIWARFMIKATAGKPQVNFFVPEKIILKKIDPETGYLSIPDCPTFIEEAFLKGTEPISTCPLHSSTYKKGIENNKDY